MIAAIIRIWDAIPTRIKTLALVFLSFAFFSVLFVILYAFLTDRIEQLHELIDLIFHQTHDH